MLNSTAIPRIFKIDGGGCKTLSRRKVSKINTLEIFQGFIILIKEIDRIAGIKDEIVYLE